MSENYPSDVKLNENPDGTVSFATEVVATIAGLAATEVDGVASMSSPSSGFADMFTRKNTRNFTKGVRIDLDGNKVAVDITIVVDYGSPVPDVARNIQENVKKAIETMSGLDVRSVDVHVSAISFEREQRANAELDEQHRKMLERNAETAAEEEAEPEKPSDEPEQVIEVQPVIVTEPEPEPVVEATAEPEPVVEEEAPVEAAVPEEDAPEDYVEVYEEYGEDADKPVEDEADVME
ncbi:MAG: Asp23/Gls24 family envelope stress response protein [Clostridia bacterium]|nr:Asp23/Gls24 family envelope stress response protein [Clostridia bacterium]